jgi:hypothetical protein
MSSYKAFKTTLCYDQDSLSNEHLVSLLRQGIHFKPSRVRMDRRVFPIKDGLLNDQICSRIIGYGEFHQLEIETELSLNGPRIDVVRFSDWGFLSVYWKTPYEDHPSVSDIEAWTKIAGFNMGTTADVDDVVWQNMEAICNYESSRKPHQHLPKIYDPDFEEEKIDISQNPGKQITLPGMWLMSTWRMWFGTGAFQYFSPERIVAFAQAYRIERLDSSVIFVELYEDGASFDLPENRARQMAFREWIGLQELEKHALEYLEKSGKFDSPNEMKDGHFQHGGVWQYTEWLDASGKAVRKSRAVKKRETEYSAQFKRIWTSGTVNR